MARGSSGNKPPTPEQLFNSVRKGERTTLAKIDMYAPQDNFRTGSLNTFEYAEAMRRTGMNGIQGKTPISALPTIGRSRVAAQNISGYLGTDFDDINAPSMEYYAFDEEGYGYNFNSTLGGRQVIGRDPAPITEAPTSTTDPDRPRTVAAGYDPTEKKLTVIFRDGTYYNYFDVTGLEWSNFVRARSKGRYILAHLNSKPRGKANVLTGTEDVHARAVAYRFLRTGQFMRQGVTGKQSTSSRRGTGYAKGNLGGTGRARAKKASGPGITGPSGVTKPKIP